MPARVIFEDMDRAGTCGRMLNEVFFSPVAGCAFPVFCAQIGSDSLFYAPGYLAAVKVAHADFFSRQLILSRPELREAALLVRSARSALDQWETQHAAENFSPFCLTVYTSQRCNLNCAYCFSRSDLLAEHAPDVSLGAVLKAAEVTAQSCRRHKQPFSFVLHGGGEPLLDPRLPELLREVSGVVTANGLPIHRYLATNGVVPEATAAWAAAAFDEIGLSCDGPDDLQNGQRPRKDGGLTADAVRQTAHILKDAGKKIQIRATVTPENFDRIPDIVGYAAESLHAETVRVEPVFRIALSEGREVAEAAAFCDGFLLAKAEAAKRQCKIEMSGSRIQTIHGRYCQIFRHVLQVVPGDGVSACFLTANRREAETRGLTVDPKHDNLGGLAAVLRQQDPACETCFNRFHCARGCPDHCPVDGVADHGSFRCRVNRTLAAAQITDIFESRLRPLLENKTIPYAGTVIL